MPSCACQSCIGSSLTNFDQNVSVATVLWRYLVTICTLSTGHNWKYPFWIALIHVDLTWINDETWMYLTKSIWFVRWYDLLILCSMSSCGLLFSKGTIHNPVYLLLVPVKITPPSFMMWMFVCVKTTLHPESHIFTMYINEPCVIPARIRPYFDFFGSCGNSNVHYLVGIIVPPFGRPTVIGGLLDIVCSWRFLGLM